MRKNPRKLALSRETLHQLEGADLREVEGAAAAPPTFAVLACYSNLIPTCVCTGTGP